MSKRVADLIVETLQAAGVKRCYGIVGDTLNRIAHAIDRSEIDWVHMRHEEAGALAAGAEAQFTGRLTACAGSCRPVSLHFINGLYEAPKVVAGDLVRARLRALCRQCLLCTAYRKPSRYVLWDAAATELASSAQREPDGASIFLSSFRLPMLLTIGASRSP